MCANPAAGVNPKIHGWCSRRSFTCCRRLTLIDVARAWPGAQRVRAPLKALDRVLGNRHLCVEREGLYAAMGRWLVRGPRPIIVVDWSDLKADRSWYLLRAAVPVGGRTLTLLDMVFPAGQQGSPQAEKQFLHRLAHVKPLAGADSAEQWVPCKALYQLVIAKPRDLGLMEIVRTRPLACRMVLHAKPLKGSKQRTRHGVPARSAHSRKNARRQREPWLLLALSARQIVALYARRMQIELAFRDLKSHRYGQGFEDSLTRHGQRIEVLLLLSALAAFACWLVGMACEAAGIDRWLAPRGSRRRLYSMICLGREALVRRWPSARLGKLLAQLRHPCPPLLDQLTVPA